MKTYLVTLALACAAAGAFGQTPIQFFELNTSNSEHTVALQIEGTSVRGSQYSGPAGEGHGAYGKLTGNVREDGTLHVTFNYEIEGSQQSEEQLMRIEGDKLYIGEGELEEHGPGQMVLKNPRKVTFDRALKKMTVSEPEVDSPEGQEILKPVRLALAKMAEVPVSFDGSLRVARKWARFVGSVVPAEGLEVADKDLADKMENREFLVQLKQEDEVWKVVRMTFAQTDGVFIFEDSDGESESAPWPLEEEMDR